MASLATRPCSERLGHPFAKKRTAPLQASGHEPRLAAGFDSAPYLHLPRYEFAPPRCRLINRAACNPAMVRKASATLSDGAAPRRLIPSGTAVASWAAHASHRAPNGAWVQDERHRPWQATPQRLAARRELFRGRHEASIPDREKRRPVDKAALISAAALARHVGRP